MVARKHDKDDVRVVVRERPETVKVLLACRVPEGEFDCLAWVFWVRELLHEVLEHSRDVRLGSGRTVTNTRLGTGSPRILLRDMSCHSLGSDWDADGRTSVADDDELLLVGLG